VREQTVKKKWLKVCVGGRQAEKKKNDSGTSVEQKWTVQKQGGWGNSFLQTRGAEKGVDRVRPPTFAEKPNSR